MSEDNGMSDTPLKLIGWPKHWLEYFKRSLENTRPFPEHNRPKEDQPNE